MNFDPGITMILVVLQNALFVVLTLGAFWGGVLVLRAFGRRLSLSLAPLGFIRPPQGGVRAVLSGIGVGLAGVVLSALLAAASQYVLRAFGYPADNSAQQPLMEGISSWVSENPAVAIPAVFLIVGLVTPVAEEILFRGGIFGGLRRLFSAASSKIATIAATRTLDDRGSRATEARQQTGGRSAFVFAAAVSSAMFASLHLEPVLFLSIFTLAMGLCWLRIRGGLLAPIAAHATFNSFTVTVLVLSGLGFVPDVI
jgi:membrane protease YdiL (CAAX protease family)